MLRGLNCRIPAGGDSTYRKPFGLVFMRAKNEEWRALGDDFRTLQFGPIAQDLSRFDQASLG
jgi:hypothetical protein